MSQMILYVRVCRYILYISFFYLYALHAATITKNCVIKEKYVYILGSRHRGSAVMYGISCGAEQCKIINKRGGHM